MANIAGRDVKPNDLGVLVAGVVFFVFSFFHWFSKSIGPYTYSRNGWQSGFLGWASVVLGLAAFAWVALRVFTSVTPPTLPVGSNLLTLGLSGLATFFVLLKLIIGYSVVGVDIGRSFGLYVALIAVAVETAFAFLNFKESGEKLPDFRSGTGGSSAS